jgi:REP element-mobilizing transposase RayT
MNIKLEHGKFYHIYNRGNNYEDIFKGAEDYLHFLDKLDVYINSIADIYAWCLMKNHFHLLVRIKEDFEIGYFNSENINSNNPDVKWKTYFPEIIDKRFVLKPKPIEQFKHLFNAYSRWYNKRHLRTGSLFSKNYERKEVTSEKYFTNLIVYIHNNPIKHGFAEHTLDYPWTSYISIKSEAPSIIKRNEVIRYFGGVNNFEFMHDKTTDEIDERIRDIIIE